MKRWVILLLFLILDCSIAPAVQKVKIVTYEVLPPFAFKNERKELTGAYIDIVKRAIARMPDYEVEFIVAPWARAKHIVKTGNAFAILPPYFHAHDWLTDTEPKRPYIWPYSLELHRQTDVVICKEEVLNSPRPVWPDDYQGLTFVMWRGDGRAGVKFDRLVKEKKIYLLLLNKAKSAVAFMAAGRADCTVTSRLPFAWYVRELKKTGEYQKYDSGIKLKQAAVIAQNAAYLGYSDIDVEQKYPYKKDFTIKFDIEIHKMTKSGEIAEIISHFTN